MRRVCLVVAAAVLVAGAAACSEDPDPQVAPPDPPTPTVTTTPASGPVAPTLPPEAEGDDAAAAEAFVRFYWEMVNFAQRTGDVAPLDELGSEACTACAGGAAGIRETYERGGTIEGGRATVLSARGTEISSSLGRAFVVMARVETSRQRVVVPGAEDIRRRGGVVRFQFVVQRRDGRWAVARWDAL
ncbi:DUF6318 family protein [Nocardioides ochotonae]|uniref:DUF6318 family protein n=1 Tax=Nocardioides ochotonae TaxID=2685869 RepID=UPI003C7D1031